MFTSDMSWEFLYAATMHVSYNDAVPRYEAQRLAELRTLRKEVSKNV